jgi:hypothetical protein
VGEVPEMTKISVAAEVGVDRKKRKRQMKVIVFMILLGISLINKSIV